jgi:hypothetical protein
MIDRSSKARSGSRMMHGGWTAAMPFDDTHRRLFDAFVDTLIPPEDGWPDARTLGIADLASSYLVPDGEDLSFYPHLTLSQFAALLDAEVGDLVAASDPEQIVGLDARVATVAAFEQRDPARFALVRDFVYFIYYGNGAVVRQIRDRTRYGADFHGAPQPLGYADVTEGWGDTRFTTRGVFIATDAVTRRPQEGTTRAQ